jgi:long-subunit acyl-CoA synthetase (AMP-forming)
MTVINRYVRVKETLRFSHTQTRSIKSLVRLQGGEYIALERLESTYKSCDLVSSLCVHAILDATQPVGIIVSHEAHLRAALSDDQDANTVSLAGLCAKPKVRELILKECNAAGKKSGFKNIEVLQAVVLTANECQRADWSLRRRRFSGGRLRRRLTQRSRCVFDFFWTHCALMLTVPVVEGVWHRDKEVKVVRYPYVHTR